MKKRNLSILFIFSFLIPLIAQKQIIPTDTLHSVITDLNDKEELQQINKINYSGLFHSKDYKDSQLSNKKLNTSFSADATRMLQSQSTGLIISANSYSPGASSKIIIRGHRSIMGNNQPMILLNGMPIDNSEWNNIDGGSDQSNRLIDLDPNFIETIEVIKGAAARARYGIVGGNGIISISTKQGYKNKSKISFKSSFGIDQISNKLSLQNTYSQGRIINGESVHMGPLTGNAFSWGPPIDQLRYNGNEEYPFDSRGELIFDPNSSENKAQAYDPYQFFQNGFFSNLALNISGGKEKFTYALGGNANKQSGIIPTTNFNRFNLSSVFNFDLTSNFSLQVNAFIAESNAQRNQTGSNLNGIMLGLLRSPPSFDNSNGSNDPVNDPSVYELPDGTQRSYRHGIYDNPYWSLNKSRHNEKVSRQILKVSGIYSLSKNIDVLFNIGAEKYNDNRKGGRDIDPSPFRSDEGSAYDRQLSYSAKAIDLSARHNFHHGTLLKLTSTIGLNYNQSDSQYQTTEGTNLRSSNNVNIENSINIESTLSSQQLKRSGGIFTIDADYNDYLSLSGSIKQDYSNKFGKNTNGFLSYGLGVNFSITNLLNSNKVESSDLPYDFSFLASVGKFGNGYGATTSTPKYLNAIISGDAFIPSSNLENPEPNDLFKSDNITAEEISAYDLGFNFSIKENRINLGIIYYSELSDGLILTDNIASSTGYRFIQSNLGAMVNKGIDVSLSTTQIERKRITWKSSFHFNKNKNIVTKLNVDELTLNGFTSTSVSVLEDQSFSVIYGNGFIRNEENKIIIGQNGWPLVDPKRKVLGDPNPDWTMYFTNSFKIGKNLSLFARIDIKQGGQMWCGTCGVLDYLGRTQKSVDERNDKVIFDGVTETGNPNTQEVNIVTTTGNHTDNYRVRYGFGGITEMSIYDASWIRLRNISLKYELSDLLNIKAIKNLSLSIFGENLVILTEYPGIDPETNLTGNSNGFGIDYFNNPGTKRYGLSLQASF